jgi:branched-chain amino acid transport system permease protein
MGRQIAVAAAATVMICGFGLFRDLKQFRMLVFGLAIVAIMVGRPRGLVSSRGSSVALGVRRMVGAEDMAEARG